MKRFLVTRPLEDALSTARLLEARGHVAEIVPLLNIEFDEQISFADIKPQGLLISSANGIRAFAKCDSRRDVDVLTVGPASAEEATALGFQSVAAAGGDVSSLVQQAAKRYRPDCGVLCHVTGSMIAGDLSNELTALGFHIVRKHAYAAHKVDVLPAALRQVLMEPGQANVSGILFYSRRTTRCFVDLVQAAGLEAGCALLRAFCLSEAAAEPLVNLQMKSVAVGQQKNQSALLDLCDIE